MKRKPDASSLRSVLGQRDHDPDNREETNSRKIRVISRAASILRVLEGQSNGLTLGQIAKRVALPRSTVQRITDALGEEGFLIAASPSGGLRLGPALISIAASAKIDIVEFAHPTLLRLARETGETVDLSVLDHDKIVFVDQVPGTHRLRAASAVGVSFPLHSSSAGKVMLAALPEPQLNRFRKLLKFTPVTRYTLTSWEELNREIRRAHTEGVAFDREETTIGLCSVSAALRFPGGELAAVAIPAPTQRFALLERSLARRLKASCQALQNEIDRRYGKTE